MDSSSKNGTLIISPSESGSPPDPAGNTVRRLLEEEARNNDIDDEDQNLAEHPINETGLTSKFIVSVISIACVASFQFGYNVGLTNSTLPYIAWEFNWCENAVDSANLTCNWSKMYDAIITSTLFVGAIVGSLTSIHLLAKGRRFSIVVSFLLFFIGSITAGICQSTSEVIWSRALTGVGTGIAAVSVPVYISEMSPAISRGFYGVFHQVAIVSGILLSILLGLPPVFQVSLPTSVNGLEDSTRRPDKFPKFWWRFQYILPSVFALISGVLLCLLHRGDTPQWHIEHKEKAKAAELLTKIVSHKNVTTEIKRIENELAHNSAHHGFSVYKDLLKRGQARTGLVIALLLSLCQQLTGINAFATGCSEILKASGFSRKQATLFTTLIFGLNVLISIPAALLIERIGRKKLLLAGMVGQVVALGQGTIFLWSASEQMARYSALAGAIAFVLFFAMSLGPVVWVYIFEIFPSNVKRPAVGLAVAANWLGSAAITATARMVDIKIQFTLFTALGIIAGLWILFFVKETKGRPLGDSPY